MRMFKFAFGFSILVVFVGAVLLCWMTTIQPPPPQVTPGQTMSPTQMQRAVYTMSSWATRAWTTPTAPTGTPFDRQIIFLEATP